MVIWSVIMISCDNNSDVDPSNLKITQAEALKLVEKYYIDHDYSVSISENVITANTSIKCSEIIHSPNYNSWLVFIDEHPQQNWEHPCKLIFVNANTGEICVREDKFPPNLSNLKTIKQKETNVKIEESDYLKISKNQLRNNIDTSDRWAIIISGGGNQYSNHERYWNDCSAIFSTLKNVYGYKQSNIKVIIADGTNTAVDRRRIDNTYDSSPLDLDGDGMNDIQYAATKNNVKNVITQVLNSMKISDKLFIFVTDHGGLNSNNESILYLWNNETITASEFTDVIKNNYKVDRNSKAVHVVMGQCNSGGFASTFESKKLGNYSISTACAIDEGSWATSNLLYDEYIYYWISAMAGKNIGNNSDANADTDNDGLVTFYEAYIYARDHDSRNETQQYSTYRNTYGSYYGLWTLPYGGRN